MIPLIKSSICFFRFTGSLLVLWLLVGLLLIPPSGVRGQGQGRSIAKPVGTERRIALVIGNADYIGTADDLKNPLNDANDMEAALKKLGFEVIKVLNTDRVGMGRAINAFRDRLSSADVAFFYYAGHGVSFANKNYLLPTDYDADCLEQIEDYGIALSRVLGDIAAKKVKNSFVVLDACRNLPDLRVCEATKRDAGGNYALINPNNPKGSMVVYATEEGTKAEDRSPNGRNGLFTGALLQYLTKPDLSLRNILDQASLEVERLSNGAQTPARYDKIYGDFYFLRTQGYTPPPPPPPRLVSGTTKDLPYGPRMVYVEGGSFQMGSNDGAADEKPVHTATVGDFWIAQTETTVGQYLEFCDATNTHWPEWLEKGNIYHIETGSNKYYADKGYNRQASNLPIVGVSWLDAVAYADWLTQKTGLKYRLPTEAEWEYAARGGKLSNSYTYAGSNDIGSVAWTSQNANSRPQPVAQKGKNELGLYDMSGNVWEWCTDWFKGYPGSTGIKDYTNYSRVLRGGSWGVPPNLARVAFRFNGAPDLSFSYFGFRVVVSQFQ